MKLFEEAKKLMQVNGNFEQWNDDIQQENSWIDDSPSYGTIHRLASLPSCHGTSAEVIRWCFERIQNLRVEPHSDNQILQHIIHLADSSQRLAYQKN